MSQDPWGQDGTNIDTKGMLDGPDMVGKHLAQGSESSVQVLIAQGEAAFAREAYESAYELAERALELSASDEGVRALMQRIQERLLPNYERKLGALSLRPHARIPASEMMWLKLDHRAGFVLAQIDGLVTYEDLLSMSHMPRFDTLRILVALLDQDLIGS